MRVDRAWSVRIIHPMTDRLNNINDWSIVITCIQYHAKSMR